MSPTFAIDRERVAGFCRRHHVRRLALFGSVLKGDFGPESVVDVLVDFEPGHVPGLIRLAGFGLFAWGKEGSQRRGQSRARSERSRARRAQASDQAAP